MASVSDEERDKKRYLQGVETTVLNSILAVRHLEILVSSLLSRKRFWFLSAAENFAQRAENAAKMTAIMESAIRGEQ